MLRYGYVLLADAAGQAGIDVAGQRINELQTNLGRAEAIQTAAMFLGDPGAVNTDLQRFMAVTAADIQRVARTYLKPENSVITLITPETPKP